MTERIRDKWEFNEVDLPVRGSKRVREKKGATPLFWQRGGVNGEGT